MKVAPYHTVVPEYGGERNVYHNDNQCPDGRRIKPEHKTPGDRWPPAVQGLRPTVGANVNSQCGPSGSHWRLTCQ